MHVHTHAIIKTGQVDTGSPRQLLRKDPKYLRFQSHPLSLTSCQRRRRRIQLWHDGWHDVRDKQDCESVNVSHQCVAHIQSFQFPWCSAANAQCNVVTAPLWWKSSWSLLSLVLSVSVASSAVMLLTDSLNGPVAYPTPALCQQLQQWCCSEWDTERQRYPAGCWWEKLLSGWNFTALL